MEERKDLYYGFRKEKEEVRKMERDKWIEIRKIRQMRGK